MKIKVLLLFFAVSVFYALPKAIAADQYIYKWKDESGMIHYTERPPETGIAFEKVRRSNDRGDKSAPVTPPAAPTQPTANAENGQKGDKYEAWRDENCKIATQNLDILQNSRKVSDDDGQGGKKVLSDEEKAEKIKKTTEQRDKYCKQNSDNN